MSPMNFFKFNKQADLSPEKDQPPATPDPISSHKITEVSGDQETAELPEKETTELPQEAEPAFDVKKDRSLYQALLAGLYDAIFMVDSKGNIIGSSPRVESYFGYTEPELWNISCTTLIPKMTPTLMNTVRQRIQSGRFIVVNARARCKNGETFPAEIAVSQIHFLNPDDLVLSVRNLTRREKARQAQEIQIEAVRNSAAAIIVCRNDGRIEYVNPALLKILQYEKEEDILHTFIGDHCTSSDATSAMIRVPLVHGKWIGTIEMKSSTGNAISFTASSGISAQNRDAPNIILTLIPLPRRVVVS